MDDVITLISESVTGHDSHGNEIKTTEEREVMCRVYSVTRSEFYSAATANLHPEFTVRLSDFEDYQNEKLVRYNGTLYSVIRTFRDSGSLHAGSGLALNEIELVLERQIGDGA